VFSLLILFASILTWLVVIVLMFCLGFGFIIIGCLVGVICVECLFCFACCFGYYWLFCAVSLHCDIVDFFGFDCFCGFVLLMWFVLGLCGFVV